MFLLREGGSGERERSYMRGYYRLLTIEDQRNQMPGQRDTRRTNALKLTDIGFPD